MTSSVLRYALKLTAIFALFSLVSFPAKAVDPVYSPFLSNVAIQGYDPVAYFTKGAAIKGKKDFQYKWKGAKWRFSSEQNMKLFAADPEAYEPQFGGYCAYAVALGETAGSDPHQFTIYRGKLYMNYNANTRVIWGDNRDTFIEDATQNWPKLLAK